MSLCKLQLIQITNFNFEKIKLNKIKRGQLSLF